MAGKIWVLRVRIQKVSTRIEIVLSIRRRGWCMIGLEVTAIA